MASSMATRVRWTLPRGLLGLRPVPRLPAVRPIRARRGREIIVFHQREFFSDQVDEALEQLNAAELPPRNPASFEERLSDLRAHEGSVCAIELSFDHEGRVFLFDLRTEWFEEFSDLLDEIQLLTAEPDEATTIPPSAATFRGTEPDRAVCMLISRWLIPTADPDAANALAASLGVQPVTAAVLLSRGIADAEAARRFLTPDLEHLHDPALLTGMRDAVERLKTAIQAQEKILIYGDYDVDGTVSVVILKKAIEMAGGEASFHVPHRLRDGYGMRAEVIERAAAMGVTADHQRRHRHPGLDRGAEARANVASTSSSPIITCRKPSFRRRWRC